jgi:hypothetical protein
MAMTEVQSERKDIKYGDAARFAFEDKGDEIEGYLVLRETFTHDDKDLTKYVFKTDDGFVSTLGSVKLIELLGKVEIGTRVRVTYTGKVPTKNGKMKDFKVLNDPTDRIEA